MDTALLAVRVLLATVFAVAGVAKLADLPGSRTAVADFGVPAALARPLGLLLPLVELGIAVALLPVATAWWGALAALALLLLFVAGIGLNLAQGNRPDCHCFGQLHSEPVGPSTLIRSAGLAAAAAFILVQGPDGSGSSAVAWLGGLTPFEQVTIGLFAVGGAVLVTQCWFLVQVLRQNGRLLLRLDVLEQQLAEDGEPAEPSQPHRGLPLGSRAPAFSLAGLNGETMTLDALRVADKPVLLLFTDPGCGPCNALLPEVGRWQREQPAITLAVVTRGTAEANRAKSAEHGIAHVLLQQDREVSTAYQANATPSMVLVQPDGTIGSAVAAGRESIKSLVASTSGGFVGLNERAQVPAPALPMVTPSNGKCPNCGRIHAADGAAHAAMQMGVAAPPLRLPDLDGRQVDLEGFRGQRVLLLFWNPACGFCQRMLPELRRWEANPPADAPRVLVVSTGTAEANRTQQLQGTVLLDDGFTVGRAFGASGTPSAVLVDEQNRIASAVAAGATDVWTLLGGPPAVP